MKTIWIVMPLFPVGLVDHCVLSDGTDLIRPDLTAGQHETRERPAAKLILTLEDFDADYFMWGGYTLVSEKMRRAMALGPSDIQYFDIDASESALLPKSKHYQIMHVPVTEYMTDQKNLAYRPLKVPRPSVESGGWLPRSLPAAPPNRRTKSSTIDFAILFSALMHSR